MKDMWGCLNTACSFCSAKRFIVNCTSTQLLNLLNDNIHSFSVLQVPVVKPLIKLKVFYILLFLFFSDDHSRVVLSLNEGDPNSHYINANYVDVSITTTRNF